jgi:ABC-type Fe3+-siderophore transport system permease subunit
MVAVSGAIGFVGLVIPHIVRMRVDTDHARVLPVSVLLGAIFLIWVDVGALTPERIGDVYGVEGRVGRDADGMMTIGFRAR